MGTRTAFDIVWNERKKVYQLVKVEYNYQSKKTDIKRLETLAEDEHIALYKAKELIVKMVLGLKDPRGIKVQTLEDNNEEEL